MESRRAEWSFRLRQELKRSTSGHFLTLTYAKAPINQENNLPTLCKTDFQAFIKRLRKRSPTKLRYYAVGEYGSDTQRPHYHALLFNAETKFLESELVAAWSHGHCQIAEINDARIHYVTKFHVNKIGEYPGRAPPFALMSRRPGIGSNYLDTHAQYHKDGLRGFTRVNGIYARLPRYYVDKLFTKEEKEQMRLLGENEREAYFQEIERLSKFVDNPHEHYTDRRRHEHDNVKHKSNRNDKI